MKDFKNFTRKATPDFPLSIHYFAPSMIFDKPGYTSRHEELEILYLRNGTVEMYVGGNKLILTAGDIHILPPRIVHSIRTADLSTQYINLKISLDLFDFSKTHFFYQKFISPLRKGTLCMPQLIRATDPLHPRLLAQLERLDISQEGTDAYTARLLSIAMNLCTELMPYCTTVNDPETAAPTDSSAASEACLAYINSHYTENFSLQDLADYVHLHPNYLCALFKDFTGKTVFQHLNHLRVLRAGQLLRTTQMNIARIAESCGYQDPNLFSRKFKIVMGCSPTAYRKRFLNERQ